MLLAQFKNVTVLLLMVTCAAYCGFRILDREYVTLPTANHYVNTNQRSSRTNSAIHYVTILP